jgi:hypothetical protein
MNKITTVEGFELYVLPNVLNLRHNSICKTPMNTVVLVHNATKRLQLVFEPDVNDWVIQSCVFAIERIVEPLPMTITISNTIPPITNL